MATSPDFRSRVDADGNMILVGTIRDDADDAPRSGDAGARGTGGFGSTGRR